MYEHVIWMILRCKDKCMKSHTTKWSLEAALPLYDLYDRWFMSDRLLTSLSGPGPGQDNLSH